MKSTVIDHLSVVVPVYNSEASLPELVGRLEKVLAAVARTFELILVNDGSRDRSWEKIGTLRDRHSWVRGIDLARNFGQHNALLCGIRAARYGTIITLDDDLQNPPEEIPVLLAKLQEGYDVVYGCPRVEQHGWFRDLASQITKMVLKNMMGAETARRVSAFRAFRTDLREAFAQYRSSFISIDVLLTWGTSRFSFVFVNHLSRAHGHSQYTFRKLVLHALNMLTGFSTLPLQFASLLGFGFTLFGLIVLGYVLVSWMKAGSVVPGFPFLASIIAIFSGGQFLALGIIGEYMARMHFRMLNKPTYVMREDSGVGLRSVA